MKIKDYKLFLESNEDINSICRKYDIINYTINEDGTVDVDGSVYLYNKGLTQIPLKFGKISGPFDCDNNKLTSLEGSPKYVGGYFSCNGNQLKTLEGGPEIVIGEYHCNNNQLVNFKGFPEDYVVVEYAELSDMIYGDNPVYKLLEDIPSNKWLKLIYWCNEFDAITDDGKVIPERMEEVYHKIGLEYEEE